MVSDFLAENQLGLLRFLVVTLEENEIKYQVTVLWREMFMVQIGGYMIVICRFC